MTFISNTQKKLLCLQLLLWPKAKKIIKLKKTKINKYGLRQKSLTADVLNVDPSDWSEANFERYFVQFASVRIRTSSIYNSSNTYKIEKEIEKSKNIIFASKYSMKLVFHI